MLRWISSTGKNWYTAGTWATSASAGQCCTMELQSETPMKIRYQNGTVIEGSTLSRTEENMRIAVKGRDDVMQFTNIHGTWVSEECEPVIMEMGITWRPADHFSDDNFICPQELATRLIHS